MYRAYTGFRWLEKILYKKPEFFHWGCKLPINGPAIFAFNHPGNLDPGVLAAHFRRHLGKPAFFLAMHKVGKVFGINLTFKWFWIITIDEQKRLNCLERMLDVLKKGYCLAISPKGKLDHGKPLTLDTTQNGVAYLACLTGIPVYPIGYSGPTDRSLFDFLKILFSKQSIRVKVGKPLYFPKIKGRIPKKVILKTKQTIIDAINDLVEEIKSIRTNINLTKTI